MPIAACKDPLAANFNESAQQSDSSQCVYLGLPHRIGLLGEPVQIDTRLRDLSQVRELQL
jgi:hypothetical protein